ncbi:MAG: hypothetical protein K2K48_05525 [Anaeroplasmataceae bacterium]|nr:hypothetical protein [Anaeroplasmataceae bacterium]MDE6414854.1 hypothetical protein [Anaeroplasmataceae bacterium]
MDKLKLGLEILNTLNEYSFEAYIVGGAVRDYIRQSSIEDVDLTTNAMPEDIKKIFSDVTREGENYLSSRIHYKGYTFEITTFRTDLSYIDHRHPQSIPVKTLEEDLSRRDFTMNALAMNKDKEIVDLYHGVEDINRKVIRAIGDPIVRFNEDALRVLRALDFASRFNFQLDDEILNSFAYDYVSFLKEEYVVSMIEKITSNPYPIGLEYIAKYHVLRGFPFYQVVCEEAYQTKYTKHIFALFFCKHNFLPTNLKISNQEIKLAKDMAYLVRNDFSDIALYYGNLCCLDEAIELYNILKGKKLLIADIQNRIQDLPIHTCKDIHFDWNQIQAKERGKITKLLEQLIIDKKVENKNEVLKKYLEIEE